MKEAPAVWNVVTGERIVPLTWSFADHFASLSRLLDLSGDQPCVETIKREAGPFLDRFVVRDLRAA